MVETETEDAGGLPVKLIGVIDRTACRVIFKTKEKQKVSQEGLYKRRVGSG